MKFNGPVYMNRCKIITTNNYYNSDKKEEEKEKAEESDDSHFGEVVEVKPVPVGSTKVCKPSKKCQESQLKFIDCIAEQETAHILMKWLHQMMDNKDKPKQKLIYLRAISEAGYFSQTPDHDVYIKEFGQMARSSYYDWMQGELRYDLAVINKLIEQYSLYLTQFPK